jgi:hypothetical protein
MCDLPLRYGTYIFLHVWKHKVGMEYVSGIADKIHVMVPIDPLPTPVPGGSIAISVIEDPCLRAAATKGCLR